MSSVQRLAALLALLVLVFGSPRARAEDDDATPLAYRVFTLGSLTAGRTDFIPGQPPWVTPDMVSDEENPLFGAEGEEPILPMGTVDEVIELVKNAVNPWFWEEREGADIRSLGEDRLVVKATPAMLDQVGLYLGRMETMHGLTVTLDVHAVRLTPEERRALGPPGAALDDARVAALLQGEDAGPSVGFTALAGARAAAYAGTRRAWISDADVEVAEGSQSPDPIVSVANLGLIADMRAMPAPDGRSLLVGLRVALSAIGELRDAPTGASGSIETPAYDLLVLRSALHVPSGAWVLADGVAGEGGDTVGAWTLLVRATPHRHEIGPGGLDLPGFAPRTIGPMQLRYFPVPILSSAIENRTGRPEIPIPSSYTPPEPPELPEPWPIVPPESIVGLLADLGGYGTWEDPATLEIRNRVLLARNTPQVLATVDRFLGALREGLVVSTDTTLEIVEMPVPRRAAPRHRRRPRRARRGVARRGDPVRPGRAAGDRDRLLDGRRPERRDERPPGELHPGLRGRDRAGGGDLQSRRLALPGRDLRGRDADLHGRPLGRPTDAAHPARAPGRGRCVRGAPAPCRRSNCPRSRPSTSAWRRWSPWAGRPSWRRGARGAPPPPARHAEPEAVAQVRVARRTRTYKGGFDPEGAPMTDVHAHVKRRGRDFTLPGAEPHYPPDLQVEPVHLDIALHVEVRARRADGHGHAHPARPHGRHAPSDPRRGRARRRRRRRPGRAPGDLRLRREASCRIDWADAFEAGEERRLAVRYAVEDPATGLFFSGPTDAYPEAPALRRDGPRDRACPPLAPDDRPAQRASDARLPPAGRRGVHHPRERQPRRRGVARRRHEDGPLVARAALPLAT